MNLSRRNFLGGLMATSAAVSFGSLMPVRSVVEVVNDALVPQPLTAAQLGAMRNLLLPPLWQVSGVYPSLPQTWNRILG